MIVSDTAVRQRTSVFVLILIIVIIGAYSYAVLPREAAPDITIPYVFVSTNYKGVSAQDIETSITIPIEKKLKGLEGVKKMQSVSSEGSSSVNLEFVTGTDINDALEKVRNKVDEAGGDLPTDLEDDPSVFEVNISEMPIVVFSLSGTCGNSCLKNIAESLKDEFEALPGVLEAEVVGGREREIRIEVIPEKLGYYGIPITALEQAVSNENKNTSGGAIDLGDGRFQLRVPGEFSTPQELFNLVVGVHGGSPVYLRDLAYVVDSFKDETSRSRLDGRESVSIAIKKRAGKNALELIDKVDEIIDMQRHSWPTGTDITKLMDRAKEIRSMVSDLENNILSGLVLVVIVMLFALGLRNAVLVSLAIPFSMLLTFAVLRALGITLNNVVLFSLTLALGMLVDNAIVIIENIYRHMEQGVPALRAAMSATSEVAYPVIGSTLTTLAAFSPMLLWPGIMGEFMSYLPLTLIVTLISSLFVAMVVNPALAAVFMKLKPGDRVAEKSGEDAVQSGEQPVEIKGAVLMTYVRVMRWSLGNRIVVLCVSFLLLVIFFQVWLLVVGIEKPLEYFPDIDPDAAYINTEMPEGSGLDYNDALIKRIESVVYGADVVMTGQPVTDLPLAGVPVEGELVTGHPVTGHPVTGGLIADADDVYAASLRRVVHKKAGGGEFEGPSDLGNVEHVFSKAVISDAGGFSLFESRSPNHIGIQFLDFNDRLRSSRLSTNEIRERLASLPGGRITVQATEHGPPTGAPINIEISGDDYTVLGSLAGGIEEMLEKIPHVVDVSDNFEQGTPTVRVRVDRQKAALVGLSTGSIGYALKAGYNGLDVSTFREGGEDYDITVQLGKGDRRVIDVLRELMLPTPTGALVPLTSIAEISYGGSIGSIVRINNERVVTVKANVDETKIPGPVARMEAQQLLKTLPLPPDYKIRFTGEFEMQQESVAFLSQAFVSALLLIFLILVTQFNSVTQPFIIMTAVLLSLGGAFMGLTVISSPFGVIMTGVGVISLAGVVVNNGIVLVDYINKLKARGMQSSDAIVMGGATRLRPVVLTALTTILGLLPMVTGIAFDFHDFSVSWNSASSQWWRTMAIVVIFGLMVATFLTLVVVPALYSLSSSMHMGAGRWSRALRDLYHRQYERLTGHKFDAH